jgi:hypothetical protein
VTQCHKDGDPLWFVTENGRLLVSTDAGSYR